MGVNVLFLEGGTRDHFMDFLAREYPNLIDGYQQLYARKYAPQTYIAEVRGFVSSLHRRYDLAPRARPESAQPDEARTADEAPTQTAFEWEPGNLR